MGGLHKREAERLATKAGELVQDLYIEIDQPQIDYETFYFTINELQSTVSKLSNRVALKEQEEADRAAEREKEAHGG